MNNRIKNVARNESEDGNATEIFLEGIFNFTLDRFGRKIIFSLISFVLIAFINLDLN